MESIQVDLEDIKQFYQDLAPYIKTTPLQHSPWLSASESGNIFLKREDLQVTNSFTVRAALGIFSRLSQDHFSQGLVFTTPGNLGWGFLYALQSFNKNIEMTIVIPEDVVEEKILSLKKSDLPNIKIVQKGYNESERYRTVEEIAAREGKLPLFTSDRCHEVAAKGTVGLEVYTQLQSVLNMSELTKLRFICPIGSGALAAGCGIALKELMGSRVSIIGVEPEIANDFSRMFYGRAGYSQQFNATIADSLRSPMVRQEYQKVLMTHVDEVVEVSEDEILESMKLLSRRGLQAEPSAATTVAAYRKAFILEDDAQTATVCLVSAGNPDRKKFRFFDLDQDV